MKYLVRTILLAFIAVSMESCYDRDVIDFKEFNHTLPTIKNLNYTKQQQHVILNWEIPTDIASDFRRPLDVNIQKVENGIYREIIIVGDEETSRDIAIDASKTYRFIVKLSGYLTDDMRQKGKSEKVYSEGRIIDIQ